MLVRAGLKCRVIDFRDRIGTPPQHQPGNSMNHQGDRSRSADYPRFASSLAFNCLQRQRALPQSRPDLKLRQPGLRRVAKASIVVLFGLSRVASSACSSGAVVAQVSPSPFRARHQLGYAASLFAGCCSAISASFDFEHFSNASRARSKFRNRSRQTSPSRTRDLAASNLQLRYIAASLGQALVFGGGFFEKFDSQILNGRVLAEESRSVLRYSVSTVRRDERKNSVASFCACSASAFAFDSASYAL